MGGASAKCHPSPASIAQAIFAQGGHDTNTTSQLANGPGPTCQTTAQHSSLLQPSSALQREAYTMPRRFTDFEVETSCLTPSHSTALAELLRGSTVRFEPLLKPKETCGTADTDHSLPGAPRTELTQHYHIRYPHVCQGEQLLLPKLMTSDPRTYQPLVNKFSCNAGG